MTFFTDYIVITVGFFKQGRKWEWDLKKMESI